MSISTEPLYLVALVATVDSIRDDIAIVSLIALASAQWTHLIAPESLGLHHLIEVSNQLVFLEDNRISRPLHF